MKQLDTIKVKGYSEKFPGGFRGLKAVEVKINIKIQKIIDFLKNKK